MRNFDATPFAEFTIALPADWPLTSEGFKDKSIYWPVRLLKGLAGLPHDYSTFLWYGHTIPNGDPPKRYVKGTDLSCALISPPLLAPEGFFEFDVSDGRSVRILSVIPLYCDEMQLKLEQGTDALYDLFEEHELTDLVDPQRPSMVATKRRRLFGR